MMIKHKPNEDSKNMEQKIGMIGLVKIGVLNGTHVDTEIIEDEKDGLTYTFNTAWDCPREVVDKLQEILDEELPFISIESWGCVHEDGQEFEQII
jgi:hypothetical protein